ncbi:NAD(P)/FAD-dependent oxidoreductase [Phaeovulum sp.]|uniref:NAD(P)/FAD-dependent oxidoreductase n=1 Tax=Phaeovulum sp. TaxID=2934796 RepID=UPI003569A7D0
MQTGSDVLVIGGGVMGASIAYWLTRMAPGTKVRVVEMDPSYAYASTALSVASIRSQFSNPVNVQISRFGLEFIRDFAQHVPLGGVPDLGLKENGYLFLSAHPQAGELMGELAAMQRSFGASSKVLDAAAIAARFPWMAVDDLVAATFGEVGEGWFDNMGLLGGLKAQARAQGAEFLNDRVIGLERDGDTVVAAKLAKGGRVEAAAFVNAAGTRAADLLGWLGESYPVEPRKRTVFVIDAPNARHPDAPLIIDHLGYYARPEQGHWITATVPSNDGPCAADDFEPDLDQFEELIWPALYTRAPGFDAVKVIRHWVGHYAYNTLDQNAILGRHPGFQNLYLANGFSGHGLQQAPAVGRGLAEVILTGDWQSLDLSELDMRRVLESRPFFERAIV